jgi:hypothetical protein
MVGKRAELLPGYTGFKLDTGESCSNLGIMFLSYGAMDLMRW